MRTAGEPPLASRGKKVGLDLLCPGRLDRLFAPVDIAPLVYFRIAFGLLMAGELCRYVLSRHVDTLWVQPEFHFKYLGFGWVAAPPGSWPYLLVGVIILAALGIAAGFYYRFSAALFFVGFTWLFLIDQAKYMNHFYLICLLGFISCFLPAHRRWSFDSWRQPSLRSDLCPAWTLWLLRAQMGLVYFYGGVAKLNHDWLHGEPVRTWLKNRADSLAPWMIGEGMVYMICYGGLFFDLLITPLLLWKRTRFLAFALAITFHLTNNRLFSIGVFPWLGIALTALFFPPELFRQVGEWLQRLWSGNTKHVRSQKLDQPAFLRQKTILTFWAIYLAWQLLMPLRHFLYPGNVSWTEEGHAFSWHMMLRSKQSDALFLVTNKDTNETWAVDNLEWLTPRQYRKMSGRPDMIVQFAHHLAEQMHQQGYPHVRVQAAVQVAFNGRPPRLLIDPDKNLAEVKRGLGRADWILPLENNEPLPAWSKKIEAEK